MARANGAFRRWFILGLVSLSRMNSNVRSLALSLGQKPKLTAACEGSLIALESALAQEGPGATR
jgi:hypothetical protein